MSGIITPRLVKRLISAAILAPLTLVVLYLGGVWFLSLMFVAAFIALGEWFKLAKLTPRKWVGAVFGFLYIVTCFSAFTNLRLSFDHGAWLTIALIVAIWASDSGAYFMGKMIGGAKMAPKLSPNKTWAGLGGAMLFCGLALGGFYWITPLDNDLAPVMFVAGLFLGVAGQAGDLLISGVKRQAGVKDTGNLIPGHGGLLDRIDALMLSAPVFLWIVTASA